MGKCPECGAWNSITEVKLPPKSKAAPGGDFSGFAGAAGEGETEILSEIPSRSSRGSPQDSASLTGSSGAA